MEEQNRSGFVERLLPKILFIVFRGILGGIAGGVGVGMPFGAFYGLFGYFYYAQTHSFSRLDFLISQPFSALVQSTLEVGTTVGLPIGLILGLSTGTLAATFRQHCPRLLVWLALSWIAVITGIYFPISHLPDWDKLFGFTVIILAASWLAYKLTIQKIKEDEPNKASQAYTILASLSNLFLSFVMVRGFVYLINIIDSS